MNHRPRPTPSPPVSHGRRTELPPNPGQTNGGRDTLTGATRAVRCHLLREDPGGVGGEEGSGGGAGLALPEEAAEGALDRVMLLHPGAARRAPSRASPPRRAGTGPGPLPQAAAGRGGPGRAPPSAPPSSQVPPAAPEPLPPRRGIAAASAGLYGPGGVTGDELTARAEGLMAGGGSPGRWGQRWWGGWVRRDKIKQDNIEGQRGPQGKYSGTSDSS